MRLPTLAAPARLVLASVFGAVALGIWPAIDRQHQPAPLDGRALAAEVDVGSAAAGLTKLPLKRVPDGDLFRSVLGGITSTSVTTPHPVRPPWWNASVPRVDAISQLDGG